MGDRSCSTATEKGRQQWQRLADVVVRDFSESELGQLSWATLKSLALHCGVTHPLDLAHLEVAWRERQPRPVVPAPKVEGGAQTDAPPAAAAAPTSARSGSPRSRVSLLAASRRPTSAPATSASPSDRRPTSSGKVAVPRAASPKSATSTKAPVASKATTDAKGAAKPTTASKKPTVVTRRSASPKSAPPSKSEAPKTEVLSPVVPQRNSEPSPSAVPPPPEPEAPKASSPSAARSLSPSAAIDDLKAVFDTFSGSTGMNAAQFLAFMRHELFLSKSLLPRDAEAIFHQTKIVNTDHTLSYPQFRMRTIPEIASKLRISILDVIKQCNHRGLPTGRSAKH